MDRCDDVSDSDSLCQPPNKTYRRVWHWHSLSETNLQRAPRCRARPYRASSLAALAGTPRYTHPLRGCRSCTLQSALPPAVAASGLLQHPSTRWRPNFNFCYLLQLSSSHAPAACSYPSCNLISPCLNSGNESAHNKALCPRDASIASEFLGHFRLELKGHPSPYLTSRIRISNSFCMHQTTQGCRPSAHSPGACATPRTALIP
jgi:hypothetical protein